MIKVYNSKFKKGFTLVELLVVISIISLLSSVVFSSLGNARSRANTAAGIQGEANILHGIGDQLVGEWRFDQDPGPSRLALDSSSFGHNGLLGTAVIWVPNGGYNGGGTYKFDNTAGSNSFVNFGNSPSLNLSNSNFTISAWVKYSSVTDWNTILWESDVPGTGVGMGHSIQFNIYPNSNKLNLNFYSGNNLGNKSVPSNVWTHVAITFVKATKSASFYINGALDTTITTDISPSFSYLWCAQTGLRYCSTPYADFNGNINNVRLYSASISSAAIEKIYAEEKLAHQDLAIKK